MNIGIFDSGLGGLSILRDILAVLPQYNYIYLGDNARVPYGNRSAETIYQFSLQAVKYLFKQDCQLIIIACNTSSSLALHRLQKEYLPKNYPKRRILGVIRPTVEFVVEKKFQRIGIIGTKATINSLSYAHELHKLNPNIKIFQNPSPLLVPVIEENLGRGELLKILLDMYVKPLLDQHIEALLLGCTHYGIITHKIQRYVGKSIEVINQGPIIAIKLNNYLKRHVEIDSQLAKSGEKHYFVTDINENYSKTAELFTDNSNKIYLKYIELN